MKRSSKRGQAFTAEFQEQSRHARIRSKGFCESARYLRAREMECNELLEGCTILGGHVHHRKYRSRGGTNSLDNLIDLCNACHSWVHQNPAKSNELGLSLHANEEESLG